MGLGGRRQELWCTRCQRPSPRRAGGRGQLGRKSCDGQLGTGEGLTLKGPRSSPQLIPMIGFIGLGMGSAALYLLRLALRSPDVW